MGVLCTPGNPGEMILWKGNDCLLLGNPAVISNEETWVSTHLLAAWLVKGRKGYAILLSLGALGVDEDC